MTLTTVGSLRGSYKVDRDPIKTKRGSTHNHNCVHHLDKRGIRMFHQVDPGTNRVLERILYEDLTKWTRNQLGPRENTLMIKISKGSQD